MQGPKIIHTEKRHTLLQSAATAMDPRRAWEKGKQGDPFTGGKDVREMKVEAFVAVCGGDYAHDVKTYLTSLRAFHPYEVVYLYLDEKAQAHYDELPSHIKQNVYVEAVTPTLHQHATERCSKVRFHHRYFRVDWIWIKLNAFLQAIIHHKGPVLMTDADLVFAGRCEDTWVGEAVLSPHYFLVDNETNTRGGVYNAGWCLSHSEAFVRSWIELFEAGVGRFYEQHLMHLLRSKYDCAIASPMHNVGRWRSKPIRKGVISLHGHPDDEARWQYRHPYVKQLLAAGARAKRVTQAEATQKVAIVAPPNSKLIPKVLKQVGEHRDIQLWKAGHYPLSRRELQDIGSGDHPEQDTRRLQVVLAGWAGETDSHSWSADLLEHFNKNGWEVLCIADNPAVTREEQGDQALHKWTSPPWLDVGYFIENTPESLTAMTYALWHVIPELDPAPAFASPEAPSDAIPKIVTTQWELFQSRPPHPLVRIIPTEEPIPMPWDSFTPPWKTPAS